MSARKSSDNSPGEADVRALVRNVAKTRLEDGVAATQGDMLDVDTMPAALTEVSTLFLLDAVPPDGLAQALITRNEGASTHDDAPLSAPDRFMA